MLKILRLFKIAVVTCITFGVVSAVGFWLLLQVKLEDSRIVWIEGMPSLVDEGIIDMWRGIPVRYNGVPYTRSWGKHYAMDGYYYGQKWQCVEYMKRYYHDRMGHSFPDVMGHAADFFDTKTAHGTLNVKRGLVQFYNGENITPMLDDIMVWTSNGYGHVAIVTRVEAGFIEVIQQNVKSGTRGRMAFSNVKGKCTVGAYGSLGEPAGWLRVKK